MPIAYRHYCSECGERMRRRPGGKCPHCGADVLAQVNEERDREEQIEKVVAVLSTVMVLALSLFAGGCSIVEGVVIYAIVGTCVWYWGRGTF